MWQGYLDGMTWYYVSQIKEMQAWSLPGINTLIICAVNKCGKPIWSVFVFAVCKWWSHNLTEIDMMVWGRGRGLESKLRINSLTISYGNFLCCVFDTHNKTTYTRVHTLNPHLVYEWKVYECKFISFFTSKCSVCSRCHNPFHYCK